MPKSTVKAIPSGETKGEKFKRLAVARTNKVLNDYRLLVNLAGTQYNDGSKEQRTYKRKILGALLDAHREVEDAWMAKGRADKRAFTLEADTAAEEQGLGDGLEDADDYGPPLIDATTGK